MATSSNSILNSYSASNKNFATYFVPSETKCLPKYHREYYSNYDPQYGNCRRPTSLDYDSRKVVIPDENESPTAYNDRMNYSYYLTKQFNKLRGATLSRAQFTKRSSYPLRDENTENSNMSEYAYNPNHHPLKYPQRPHSCVNFPTQENNLPPRALNPRIQSYNCPEFDTTPMLPDYEDPPGYDLHSRRGQEARYPDHERSAPPVVLRDSNFMDTLPDQRTQSLYENRRQYAAPPQEFNEQISRRGQNYSDDTKRFSLPPQFYLTPEVRLSPPDQPTPPLPPRLSATPSPRNPRKVEEEYCRETSTPRGDPPPYYSHHEILDAVNRTDSRSNIDCAVHPVPVSLDNNFSSSNLFDKST